MCKELTRREMLEQVSHGSKSGTKKLLQMLPGLRSEEDGGWTSACCCTSAQSS